MENPKNSIKNDIDNIFWSSNLSNIYRFTKQRFWERETENHEKSIAIDGLNSVGTTCRRTESVSEHSWHLADICLILAPKYPKLDLQLCVTLAILHDKLEIITGDFDPLGRYGDGLDTHAFDPIKRQQKANAEENALLEYLSMLSIPERSYHELLFRQILDLSTSEALFLKALDKIHPLIYVIQKKNGAMEDAQDRKSVV